MNHDQFKEDMFKKLIVSDDNYLTYSCPSHDVDPSVDGNPRKQLLSEPLEIKKTISLICDIIAEYDKQKTTD